MAKIIIRAGDHKRRKEAQRNKDAIPCSSCQEFGRAFFCSICKKHIKDRCKQCHKELVHENAGDFGLGVQRNDNSVLRNLTPPSKGKIRYIS
jgi:hypothetical protein